jgi:hypothetical protein
MKTYKEVEIRHPVVDEVTCDVCSNVIEGDSEEYVSVDFLAGFGNVFGDGNNIQCDVCMKCLLEKLGPYCRVSNID